MPGRPRRLLQAIEVADQQRGLALAVPQFAQALIESSSIGESGEGILVGVPRDLAEELGLADSHRYLGGDCLQQFYVIGTEAPAVRAAGP